MYPVPCTPQQSEEPGKKPLLACQHRPALYYSLPAHAHLPVSLAPCHLPLQRPLLQATPRACSSAPAAAARAATSPAPFWQQWWQTRRWLLSCTYPAIPALLTPGAAFSPWLPAGTAAAAAAVMAAAAAVATTAVKLACPRGPAAAPQMGS